MSPEFYPTLKIFSVDIQNHGFHCDIFRQNRHALLRFAHKSTQIPHQSSQSIFSIIFKVIFTKHNPPLPTARSGGTAVEPPHSYALWVSLQHKGMACLTVTDFPAWADSSAKRGTALFQCPEWKGSSPACGCQILWVLLPIYHPADSKPHLMPF